MSARDNCYDNAGAESFFHSLRVEAIHGEKIPTREMVRAAVFEYIKLDCNTQRIHTAIGNRSPAAFELKQAA